MNAANIRHRRNHVAATHGECGYFDTWRPGSGERIRGGQNRREIYSRFPSLPKVSPRRTTGSGDMWVLEASLDYGDGDPYQCVFIFQMRNGQIANEVAYWSKPFPAPDWRSAWVEREPHHA